MLDLPNISPNAGNSTPNPQIVNQARPTEQQTQASTNENQTSTKSPSKCTPESKSQASSSNAQVGPGLCFGPEFGFGVRRKNCPTPGSVGSMFGERMGPTKVRRVRSSEKEWAQSWYARFGVRGKKGPNPGSASSEFGERMGPTKVRRVRSSEKEWAQSWFGRFGVRGKKRAQP